MGVQSVAFLDRYIVLAAGNRFYSTDPNTGQLEGRVIPADKLTHSLELGDRSLVATDGKAQACFPLNGSRILCCYSSKIFQSFEHGIELA